LAITRKKKEALLAQYKEVLERSNALFLTRYERLTVNQMTVLRRKLREADGGFLVVKNTLAKRAFHETGVTDLDSLLEGPVGIGFSFADPPPVAKVLVDFAKETDALTVKGGLLGTTVLDERGVKALAALPPLDVIRAQLLGVIAAPASQLAGVIAGGVRQVVNVLHAYAESGEGEGEPAAA